VGKRVFHTEKHGRVMSQSAHTIHRDKLTRCPGFLNPHAFSGNSRICWLAFVAMAQSKVPHSTVVMHPTVSFAQKCGLTLTLTSASSSCCRASALFACSTKSTCPWKGEASYYSVVVNGKENKDAAWYYPSPKPAASNIKDHVAFWKGVQVVKK